MEMIMEIKDLLKTPQVFAVKKDGILQMHCGIARDEYSLKAGWLMDGHGIAPCGDPECGCTDRAWEELEGGATIVPVSIVETAPEGAGN